MFGELFWEFKLFRVSVFFKVLINIVFLVCLVIVSAKIARAADVGAIYEDALRSSQEGRLPEALIHLKNALQIDIDHLPSRLLMAEVLIGQGNGAAAEAELEYSQAHGVNAKRLIHLFAEAYLLQDKYRQVLDVAKAASRGKRIEGTLAYLRGRAHLGLQQLSSAQREFEQALRFRPRYDEAKLGKAQVLILRDQVDLADEILTEVLSNGGGAANAWLLQANIQRLKGDLSGALSSLNRAISIEKKHLAARLARAGLLMNKGEFSRADEDVDFILKLIPLEPRAKYLKAIISAAKGDEKNASEKIQEVIVTLKSVPDDVMQNNPSYLYLAGITSYQLGNYDVAKSFLNKYLKVMPNDFNSVRVLAIIELRQGRPNIARTLLAKANVNYPDNPTILSLLGTAYMDMKSYGLAQQYFEKVVQLQPKSEIGLINLARNKLVQGELAEAIVTLLKAKKTSKSEMEINLLLANAYAQSRQFSKAITIYKQLMSASPKNSRFVHLYGAALGLSGDREGAQLAFIRALELDPSNSAAIIHLARMDWVRGEHDKTISYLETKVKEYPENYELMVELGQTYVLKGQLSKALLWYNKAYLKNDSIHVTLDGLVRTLVRSGKERDAIALIDEFVSRNPTDAQAHTMLGRIYQRINEPQKAIKAFTAATNFATNEGKSLLVLAKALSAADDRKGAIGVLKKAIARDESYLPAYIALMKLVIEDGDETYALRLAASINRLSPNTPVAHILRGELYNSLEKYVDAEAQFKKALDMGDSRPALKGLYRVYKNQKRESSIIQRAEIWLKKHPKDLPVGLVLADSYFSSGKLVKAKEVYQRLLTLYPNSPSLLNDAAEIYFVMGEKKAALEYARNALSAAPKNANFLDTVGWIESRIGNHEQALSLFRDALAYDFNNPDVKFHLALTLDKLDRRGEAMRLLREVIEGERAFAQLTQAKDLLSKWGGQ